MKKILQIIGILTLMCGSFVYNDKAIYVFKDIDDLYNEIKGKADNYKVPIIQPIITDNTVILGKNGKEVDISKSYINMKEQGYFNEKLLVYKKVYVNTYKEKIIIGLNKQEKNIVIVFRISKKSDKEILKTISNVNVYFINKKTKVNHLVLNDNYEITETLIKTNPNKYTIYPITIKNNYLLNVKKNLSNGTIFYFYINSSLKKELPSIINYIEKKGYTLKRLDEVIEE